jgi:hypothetical protein
LYLARCYSIRSNLCAPEKNAEIYKNVACQHPEQLEIEITDGIESIKSELNLKKSVEELKSILGCTKNNELN